MGEQGLPLQAPAAAGAAHRQAGVQLLLSCGENQHVSGVLPPGEGHQGQSGVFLHGQVLAAVNRQIHPALQQGGVQLLDEQALAPHLVQGAVQDPVAGGFHGDQLQGQGRVGPADVLHDQSGLGHGQPTLPAAHADDSLTHFISSRH